MRTHLATATVVLALVALGSRVTVEAHHSHAMFDLTKEVTLTGTINKVAFRNPHVMVFLDVKGSDGQTVSWTVEMSTVENEQRRGLFPSMLKPGDMITVKLNPLRDGRPGGNYTSLTTADGKTFD
jgi:Family of unknown function (DUF6152)